MRFARAFRAFPFHTNVLPSANLSASHLCNGFLCSLSPLAGSQILANGASLLASLASLIIMVGFKVTSCSLGDCVFVQEGTIVIWCSLARCWNYSPLADFHDLLPFTGCCLRMSLCASFIRIIEGLLRNRRVISLWVLLIKCDTYRFLPRPFGCRWCCSSRAYSTSCFARIFWKETLAIFCRFLR